MSSKHFYRYSVVDHLKDSEKYELILKLKPMAKSLEPIDCCECVLRGVWFGCDLKTNEIIHLLDARYDTHSNRYIVDNDCGYVVKSPDQLISSTTLMAANYCMRKSWLSAKFTGWTQANRSMLIGNVVHQLFQDSCRLRVRGLEAINDLFLSNLNNFINDFYSIGLTAKEVIEDITPYMPSIANWVQNYVHNMSAIKDSESENRFHNNQNEPKLQVLKVRDIEDTVWSTKWGLKGMVDLTLDVVIDEERVKRKLTVPLELKTGKATFSAEHVGQVILYSIIMEDMTHTNQGLLLYLKDRPQMRQILTTSPVKRDLTQLRNELVKHLNNISIGPKPLNNQRTCSQCDHLLDCALTLQTLEREHLNDSPVMSDQLIPQVISHLSDSELNFFRKWISLLNLELKEVTERDMDSKLGFWTESSTDRESKGLGFAKLTLLEETNGSTVFVRSEKFSGNSKDFNLTDNLMRRWERVALSIDNSIDGRDMNFAKRVALSMAYIKSIDCKRIELILDKKIDSLPKNALFRIDHLSSTGMTSTNYTNLLRLMDSNDNRSESLRKIVITGQPVSHCNQFKRKIVTKGKQILRTLNQNQQKAILKALSTDSYILLRGMPGAGKTQTIIALIRLLVALDQSVLITAYTHAAVDNILVKLIGHNIDFLRIGSEKRVDPVVHSYTVSAKTSNYTSVEELNAFYSGVKVVASTCLGVSSHPIFKRRTFDYCIVDEASQVLLPTCLGPLFHCNRFVLVGDHKQLPPVVQSESARELGLGQSLFKLLQSDSNTTELKIQYRMNCEIMRISNELTYNGVLKCASLQVCNQTLIASDSSHLNRNDWLSEVMATDLSKSVLFLDTDRIPGPEIRDTKGRIYNEIECKIVALIVNSFLQYFPITGHQIGVISAYQRQVRFLKESILIESLDMNTVDQFQGRDKDIIVYSCVKSNSNESSFKSEILNDERRLNVALTRAKKKLILIGSKSTLFKFKPFSDLFSALRSDQILSLTSSDFQNF